MTPADHATELRRHARKLPSPAGDTPALMVAAAETIEVLSAACDNLRSAVARLSPSDEEIRFTRDQDWTGMSGSVAWHLADRHAEGWAGIGDMMEAWRDAEVRRITAQHAEELARVTEERDALRAQAWPTTPAEVRALLSGRCAAERYAAPCEVDERTGLPVQLPEPHEDDTYTVSAHDLITANWEALAAQQECAEELARVTAERDAAHEARKAAQELTERYMAERNRARLDASREVRDEVRALTEERDDLRKQVHDLNWALAAPAQPEPIASEWSAEFEQAVQSLPTLAEAVALFDERPDQKPCRRCGPDGCSDSTSCPRGGRHA